MKDSKPKAIGPTDQEKEQAWLPIMEVMERAFAWYFWRKDSNSRRRRSKVLSIKRAFARYFLGKARPEGRGTLEAEALRLAALQCTMLSIRSLNDVFGPGTRFPDDILASQIPGTDSLGLKAFLTRAEVSTIDKYLAHLSYEWKRTGVGGYSWDVLGHLTLAFREFRKLMDGLFLGLLAPHPQLRGAAQNRIARMESWLRDMRENGSYQTLSAAERIPLDAAGQPIGR